MSGRGKGAAGIGKGGAKRHRQIYKDALRGISKADVRRLARRGGVKRISSLTYDEAKASLKHFLETVIRDSVTYTEHAKRKTVSALDVVYALKRNGRTLYGYGVTPHPSVRTRRKRPTPPVARDPKDPVNRIHNHDIYQRDIESAKPPNWLTDVAVNAPIQQMAEKKGWFLVSSLTWSMYRSRGVDVMKNKFRKVGGFADKQKIVIPINENRNHWTVLFVDREEKKMTYYNSMSYGDDHAKETFDAMLALLESESKGPEGKPPFAFDRRGWKFQMDRNPRQDNCNDCGVMVYMRVRQELFDQPAETPDAARAEIIKVLKGTKKW